MIIPDSIDRLAAVFRQLPGVGRRQALRLAIHLARHRDTLSRPLEKALEDARKSLRPCEICTVWSESVRCAVCSDADRDPGTICVVEDLPDMEAFEAARIYTGVYHVLNGRLSPGRGTGPGELTWEALLARIPGPDLPKEIILGLSLSVEGETTAAELYGAIRNTAGESLKITRIARPAGAGAEPEYWEREEIGEAITGRRPYLPESRPRKPKGRTRQGRSSSA